MSASLTSTYQQALYRRYLLWAYKTTRESLERIERKTTQLVIDTYIQSEIAQRKTSLKSKDLAQYKKLVEEFDQYIAAKQADEKSLKYAGSTKDLNPQYLFLIHRLAAIEAAIVHFLGKKALKQFDKLFNEEFSRRILESRDHH